MIRGGPGAPGLPDPATGYQWRMGPIRHKLILGSLVLAGSFGAAWWTRQQRIRTIDTTAPDVFGDAVARES